MTYRTEPCWLHFGQLALYFLRGPPELQPLVASYFAASANTADTITNFAMQSMLPISRFHSGSVEASCVSFESHSGHDSICWCLGDATICDH